MILLLTIIYATATIQVQPIKCEDDPTIPPIKCYGTVPTVTSGKYFYHENETYQLRVATKMNLKMDLNHVSCFQLDMERAENETGKVSSIFYAIEYKEYIQHYPMEVNYQFGIPEFQSFCKCDCPKNDEFCSYKHQFHKCNRGVSCATVYHPRQPGIGCQYEGPASLCCDVSVKPYEDKRFNAVSLTVPKTDAVLKFRIYVFYSGAWALFRRYTRHILPRKGNRVILNGNKNMARLNVFVEADQAELNLADRTNQYYYEVTGSNNYKLLGSPYRTPYKHTEQDKFDFLLYRNNRWVINDAAMRLKDAHKPVVVNCKKQEYIDSYLLTDLPIRLVRNSTGALNQHPRTGRDLVDRYKMFISRIKFGSPRDGNTHDSISVYHTYASAPTLRLDIDLQQQLDIVSHLHVSHATGFIATINLDKFENRFLNVTLLNAYGEFLIDMYRDSNQRHIDLVLSIVTVLPIASNYTEFLPLPSHINSKRYVCVRPSSRPSSHGCKWAQFSAEPIETFELQGSYLESEGTCPGCNKESKKSFFSYFNPRTWFNGIGSISEGFAIGIEVVMYVLLSIIVIAITRKCLWPFVQWAICSDTPKYKRHRTCDKCKDVSDS